MNNRINEIVSRGYSASDEEVKEEYFEWLTYISGMSNGYKRLANILHNVAFYAIVKNDDNRGEDGKVLRKIFENETLFRDYSCLDHECSMLEMLIGLAIRMESILEDSDEEDRTIKWFWEILSNLKLDKYSDIDWNNHESNYNVLETLDNLLERRYSRSGVGGLFPLKEPKKDQRKVEIWYQLSAYLLENYIDEREICG